MKKILIALAALAAFTSCNFVKVNGNSLSSIIGKFLNWLLVPLYTYVLAQQSDYGIVTNLYAWTALLLIILTYGMETGFFRFVNKENASPALVYNTCLISLFSNRGSTSLAPRSCGQ